MTPGGGGPNDPVAGGPARHVPVLLDEAVAALSPQSGGLYVDGTFGAGGYTQALLAIPGVRVLALDRDPTAIATGAALVGRHGGRLELRRARFGALDEALEASGFAVQGCDGVVLDIGVSSMQIDAAERGFSFRQDGPLDMRMESEGPSAADIVNLESAETIADILYHYGEERASRRIARAILHDRQALPFTSTRQLAELVARLLPGKPNEIHPATRTFQALRIAVNDELGELARALVAAERALKPGGRLAVVTFHSLEDRIVKQFFAQRSQRGRAASRLLPGEPVPEPATFQEITRHPVTAGEAELARNPRARSAKLRSAERNGAPARELDAALATLVSLPVRRERRR